MRLHGMVGQKPMNDGEGEGRKTAAQVDAKIRMHLGRKLKSAYQNLVDEPVPDKFVKLLDELRRKEGKG
jgi:hypothetical protein